jgi:DNA-binding transcriptional regulator YiaG
VACLGEKKLFSGEDLKAFRESRGWSLRRFSAVVGVSVKTLQVMEKENKPVPLQLRLALSALKEGIHPIE